MRVEEIHHRPQRARVVDVIRVQPSDDVTARDPETFVDRVRLSAIWFGYPSATSRIPSQDVERVVRTARVENEQLQTVDTLVQHTQQGAFDELALIERRDHDRNA